MTDRQCPHPTCTRAIDLNRFACPTHWFQLPPSARKAVGRAWVFYQRNRLAGVGPLLAAQDAAAGFWSDEVPT